MPADPATFLVIVCVECGKPFEVPFDQLGRDKLTRFLWKSCGESMLSIVSKPGVGKVVMAPVCGACAPKVYPPEFLKAAREHLGKL